MQVVKILIFFRALLKKGRGSNSAKCFTSVKNNWGMIAFKPFLDLLALGYGRQKKIYMAICFFASINQKLRDVA